MLTTVGIKTILNDNLTSDTMYGLQLDLTSLIVRPNALTGNQYRIHDTKTDTDVTSLDDFKTKLDADSLVMKVYRQAYRVESGFIKPFIVTPSNYKVKLIETNSNDAEYIDLFGFGTKSINFIVGYLSDADTVLPLKIIDFKLG